METWYRETVTKLYRFIYSQVQNREETEDITQETYLRCFKQQPENLPLTPILSRLRAISSPIVFERHAELNTISAKYSVKNPPLRKRIG